MNIHNIVRSLVLAGVGMVHAQVPTGKLTPSVPDGPKIEFATVDRNADGFLSKDEALLVPDLPSAFEMLDTDGDARLSRAEFSLWSRAGKGDVTPPRDLATARSGSAGAQHIPPQ